MDDTRPVDELTCLALRAADGDRLALSQFVRTTQDDVWRFCAYLVDRESADDLTQDVYLRAVPALRRFRGESSARTWLLVIARRTCADWLRRVVRQRRLAERVLSLTSTEHFVESGPDSSFTDHIEDALKQLPLERREAFVLTQLVGLSYKEAAEIAGVEVGTIRSRVSRARSSLVEMLRGELDTAALS